MRIITFLTTAVILLSSVKCKTSESNLANEESVSGVNQAPSASEGSICGPGNSYTAFTLTKLSVQPPEGIVVFPGVPPENIGLVTSDESNARIRFDICLNDETEKSQLKRLVFTYNQDFLGVTQATIDVKPSATVKGLSEAVFGDVSKLEILVPSENPQVGAVHVKAWTYSGKAFVTFAKGTVTQGKFTPDGAPGNMAYKQITFGQFAAGDPFLSGECGSEESLVKLELRIGSVKIDGKSCVKTSIRGSTHRFKSVTVTDSNPTLTAKQKKPVVMETPDQLASVFEYVDSQHNFMDKMTINLPHATYIIQGNASPSDGSPNLTFQANYKKAPTRVITNCGYIIEKCDVD